MPIEILMPALSPTMTEGNLARWLKKEGDKVMPGDVLAEIETDKATMEVESIDEGIVGKILVAEGTQNVAVNQLIALLLADGESADDLKNYTGSIVANNTQAQVTIQVEQVGSLSKVSEKVVCDLKISDERIKASPLAKRLAKLDNVDLNQISGSGPHGRIVKDDVLSFKKALSAVKASPTISSLGRNEEEFIKVPNNNMRKVIAKRLVESKQTVPHFYLSIECNIDNLLKVREEMNENAENYKLSVNDFVIKACAMSLQENPEANSSWAEDSIIRYNNVDISVAVAIDGGLITPIIKNSNLKTISHISNEMKSLAKRARENALKPEEFQGGGFSISNLGMFGIKNFKAIINPPQSCILAIGASNKRPVVVNDQVVIANVMDVSLSCDHRVVDGAVAAKFLASFKKFIENPVKMFV